MPYDTDLDDESAVAKMSVAAADDDLSNIVDDLKKKFKDDLTVKWRSISLLYFNHLAMG